MVKRVFKKSKEERENLTLAFCSRGKISSLEGHPLKKVKHIVNSYILSQNIYFKRTILIFLGAFYFTTRESIIVQCLPQKAPGPENERGALVICHTVSS
jgi:hypothetical protein